MGRSAAALIEASSPLMLGSCREGNASPIHITTGKSRHGGQPKMLLWLLPLPLVIKQGSGVFCQQGS